MTDVVQSQSLELKSAPETGTGLIVPELKANKDGTVEGYGAIFGNVDNGNDIVQAGAFAESLARGVKVKMLWQHDTWEPIGVWDTVEEDEKGLRVKGRILSDVAKGREAIALLKAEAIDGLSIGYRTLDARHETRDGDEVRIIEKAEIWEVSLVTFPMNGEATIDAVKAAGMTLRQMEREILRDTKFSRAVVAALMRDGHKGVQALSGSGDEDFSELLEAVEANSLIEML